MAAPEGAIEGPRSDRTAIVPMSGNNQSMSVVGLGAITAVGLTAAAGAAAVRAGIAGFSEHPQLVDQEGEPLIVARVPVLEEDVAGIERFFELALPAADEALTPLAGRTEKTRPIPVVLGLPPERPGLPEALGPNLAKRLQGGLRERWQVAGVQVLSEGHSAGLMALEAAWQEIQSGRDVFCLVGGVDSYLEPNTLEWLEESDQLHGAGPHNNAWGFVPGEAAGFCLVCAPETADRHKLTTLGRVLAVATAQEKNLARTGSVCLGQGLTEAFRGALRALPNGAKVDRVFCDMNGEAYRADEYGFTIARTSERFVDAGDFQAPADCWGDVGAASGPLLLGLAVAAGRKGYAKGPHALVWTSSESGQRSAALVAVDRATEGRR